MFTVTNEIEQLAWNMYQEELNNSMGCDYKIRDIEDKWKVTKQDLMVQRLIRQEKDALRQVFPALRELNQYTASVKFNHSKSNIKTNQPYTRIDKH